VSLKEKYVSAGDDEPMWVYGSPGDISRCKRAF